MPIVREPLASTAARGKFGGVVDYQFRRGVTVVRVHTEPSQPRTAAQMNMRAIFGSVQQSWRTLTLEQATGWRERARTWRKFNAFGQYEQTGQNLFCACNVLLVAAGRAMRLDAPAGGSRPVVTAFQAVAGPVPGGLRLVWQPSVVRGAGDFVQVRLQGPLSKPGQSFRDVDCRVLCYTGFGVGVHDVGGLVVGGVYYVAAKPIGEDGVAGDTVRSGPATVV